MRTARRLKLVAASGAVFLLGLTGCAGGEGNSDDAGGGGKITIGVSVPLSGSVGATGSAALCGFETYIAAANAADAFNGFEAELDTKDNQFDPSAAATIARDFATEEVSAVFIVGTLIADASRAVLEAAEVPTFVVGDGAAYSPPKNDTEFGYNPVYLAEFRAALEFMKSEGNEKLSAVSAAGAGGQAIADAWANIGDEIGFESGPAARIPNETQDFSGFAQQLKDGGATAVFSSLQETNLASLQKAADAIGYHPTWVVTGFGFGPTYLEAAGQLAEGIYVSQWNTPAAESDDPAVQQYLEDVEKFGKDCDPAAPNVAIGYNQAAILGHALTEATKDGEAPTSESIVNALQLDGEAIATTPSVTFNDKSHAAVQSVSFWKVTADGMERASELIQLD